MIEILFDTGSYQFLENFPSVPRVGEIAVFGGMSFRINQVYYYHSEESVTTVVKIGPL